MPFVVLPFLQDVDAKLTLTRVATAPALIAEVAKLSGRHLEVSPVMGTEVLMVSVNNTSSIEVLGKIALAATATWQPIEGGYRLVPDNAARGIEASRERALRLQAINEGVKKKQEAAKKGGDEAAMAAGAFMGAGKIDDFIPMLDLPAIAAMEAGDRVVFATSANGAQRPLRGNPMPVIAQWVADHNKTAKTMAGSMDQMPEEAKAFMTGPIGDRFKKMTKQVTANPSKLIVVVTKGGNPIFGAMGLGMRVEARAYGADGSLLLEESGSLDSDMMATLMQFAVKKPVAPNTKNTPIEYSADAKALIATSTIENPMSGGNLAGLKFPASLHEKLFNPDKFDPLALVPGEGLAAFAKARNKPLVGCIPDSAYPGLITNGAPKTVEEVEEGFKTGSMRLVPDASFLVIKPAEPATSRRTRVDRIALTTLLAAVANHDTPNLDELSAYAVKTVAPADNAVSMSFLTKFAPATMGSMAGMVSWDALRLFGSLTSSQRQTLASGGQVPFGFVAPVGQNALRAMLYGSSGQLSVDRPGVSNEPDIFSTAMKMMMGGGGVDIRDEPTEVAPHGLPNNGYLQATVTTDTIIRPVAAEGEVYYSLGSDELAMFHMMSTGPMAAQMQDAMKLPESGRLGSRTLWNIRGYVAQGAYVASALTDDRNPKDGQLVSLNNLPADLQAKVNAKSEKLKKSPFGAIMAMGALAGRQQAKP